MGVADEVIAQSREDDVAQVVREGAADTPVDQTNEQQQRGSDVAGILGDDVAEEFDANSFQQGIVEQKAAPFGLEGRLNTDFTTQTSTELLSGMPQEAFLFNSDSLSLIFNSITDADLYQLQVALVEAGVLSFNDALTEAGTWRLGGATEAALVQIMGWANTMVERDFGPGTNASSQGITPSNAQIAPLLAITDADRQAGPSFGTGGSWGEAQRRVNQRGANAGVGESEQLNGRSDLFIALGKAIKVRTALAAVNEQALLDQMESQISEEDAEAAGLRPHPDAIAETARAIWRNKLGREPTSKELQQAAEVLSAEYRTEFDQYVQQQTALNATALGGTGFDDLPSSLSGAQAVTSGRVTLDDLKPQGVFGNEAFGPGGHLMHGREAVAESTTTANSTLGTPEDRLSAFIQKVRGGEIDFNRAVGRPSRGAPTMLQYLSGRS